MFRAVTVAIALATALAACSTAAVAPPGAVDVAAVDAAEVDSIVVDASDNAVRPKMQEACAPCVVDVQCRGSDLFGVCAPDEDAPYCTRPCKKTSDCPLDMHCAGSYCRPDGGTCRCSSWAVASGMYGACTDPETNCHGGQTCTVVGEFSHCTTSGPAKEICNGVDDDCNGMVDDGPASMCSDGNECTVDDCVEGKCATIDYSNKPCTGGNPCLIGWCHVSICDLSAPVTCKNADKCTVTWCDLAKGCIQPEPISCDDNQACTADSCDSTAGCTHNALSGPCDDGNACSLGDKCEEGGCVGLSATCTDGSACSEGACVPAVGCVLAPNHVCDDNNVCTADSCTASGCGHSAISGTCVDGDLCTEGGACVSGLCVGVTATSCEDANPCTSDGCDAISGCTHVNLADGSTCSTGCSSGLCTGGWCGAVKAVGDYGINAVSAVGSPLGGYLIVGRTSFDKGFYGYWQAGVWMWQHAENFGYDNPSVVVTASGPMFGAVAFDGPNRVTHIDWQGNVLSTSVSPHPPGVTIPDPPLKFVVLGDTFAMPAILNNNVGILLRATLDQTPWQPLAPEPGGGWVDLAPIQSDVVAVGKSPDGSTMLARVSPDGTFVWKHILPFGTASGVAVDTNGILVVAQTHPGADQFMLLRLDNSGTLQTAGTLPQFDNPSQFLLRAEGILYRRDRALRMARWNGQIAWTQAIASPQESLGGLPLATDGQSLLVNVVGPPASLRLLDAWGHECASGSVCMALPATACDDGNLATTDRCDTAHGGCWHDVDSDPAPCADYGVCSSATGLGSSCSYAVLPEGTTCSAGCDVIGQCSDLRCQAQLPIGVQSLPTQSVSTVASDATANSIWLATQANSTDIPHLSRLDLDAHLLWSQDFPIQNGAQVKLVRGDDTGALMAGQQTANYYFARVDLNGTLLWHVQPPGPLGPALVQDLQTGPDGYYVSATETTKFDAVQLIFHLDLQGNVAWRHAFPQPLNVVNAIALGTGKIFVGGSSRVGSDNVPWLVTLDQSGNQLQSVELPLIQGMHKREIAEIAVDKTGAPVAILSPQNALAHFDVNGNLVAEMPIQAHFPLSTADSFDHLVARADGSLFCSTNQGRMVLDAKGRIQRVGKMADGPFSLANDTRIVVTDGHTVQFHDAWDNPDCATSGPCHALSISDCDDGDVCTADNCDSAHGGCWHQPLGASPACDDGNPCTIGGCALGACTYSLAADGSGCGGACGGWCSAGVCAGEAGFGNLDVSRDSTAAIVALAPASGKNLIVFSSFPAHSVFWLTASGRVEKEVAVVGLPPALAGGAIGVVPLASGWIAIGGPGGFGLRKISGTGSTVAVDLTATTAIRPDGDGVLTLEQMWGTEWLAAWDAELKPRWKVKVAAGVELLGSTNSGTALVWNVVSGQVERWNAGGYSLTAWPIAANAKDVAVIDEDVLVTWPDAKSTGSSVARLHEGAPLWTRTFPAWPKLQFLAKMAEEGELFSVPGLIGLLDGQGAVRWTRSGFEATQWLTLPATIAYRASESNPWHLTDAWLNPDCATSGPCVGKTVSDCSDGNDCTFDDCDALHGGCFHPTVSDGAACGKNGTCKGGNCQNIP